MGTWFYCCVCWGLIWRPYQWTWRRFCMPDMMTECKLRIAPNSEQAHSSLLLLSLTVYKGHKNRPQWVNLFAKCESLLPETSTFISKEIIEGIQVWARYENVALVITSTPILIHFTVNIHNLFTSPWLHTACKILQTPNELQVALVHEVN